MAKRSFPQMTESAYWKVRDAFRRAMPNKVTTTWIVANVEGYTKEASARSLLSYLRHFGLVDEVGYPTDVAKQWRLDDGYGVACDLMLRSAFPSDLVEAVAGGLPPSDVLMNLFMNHGVGVGSAQNLVRIFRLIASKEIVTVDVRTPGGNTQVKKTYTKTTRRPQTEQPPDKHGQAQVSPMSNAEPSITVLRYFMEKGRIAEIRIPADLDTREKRRLFAHLKIDLLDEVEDK